MSRIIYVAGPYTGATAWDRERNIRNAEETCLALWKAGVPAVCVHTIARHFFGIVPEETAIEIDNVILDRCDAVMLVVNWPFSKGTLAEIDRAESQGKPVFQCQQLDECIEWAKAAP